MKWLDVVALLENLLSAISAFAHALEKAYGPSDPDAQEASKLSSQVRELHARVSNAAKSSEAPPPPPPTPAAEDVNDGGLKYEENPDNPESFRL